jgi:phosphotransferase system HPr (HPr) family protein
MREVTLTITNDLGLHARAAAELVRLVRGFRSSVTITREDTGVSADAGSLIDILYLAAGKGVNVKVTADGADENAVIEKVKELFADEFREESATDGHRSTRIC